MTDYTDHLRHAAHTLMVHFRGPVPMVSPWLQSLGLGSLDGKPALHVYTKVKKNLPSIPAEWEGYPVVVRYVGKPVIRPPRNP